MPTAQVRHHPVRDYDDDGKPFWRRIHTEYIHVGMPTGISLRVWSLAADRRRISRGFR